MVDDGHNSLLDLGMMALLWNDIQKYVHIPFSLFSKSWFVYIQEAVGVYCDIWFVLCWVISLKPGVPYKSISALIHVETHICVTYSSVSFIIPGETLKSGSGQDESIMLYLSFAYL